MSESFRLSGKKLELPPAAAGWSFETRPGGWILATREIGGRVERRRFAFAEAGGDLSVAIGGYLYHGKLETASRGSSAGAADADLSAQFPGKVRKVLVADGARVAAGEALVLIEAMKMEFAVKAPSAGVVKRVRVKDGEQLSPGQMLVDFAADEERK